MFRFVVRRTITCDASDPMPSCQPVPLDSSNRQSSTCSCDSSAASTHAQPAFLTVTPAIDTWLDSIAIIPTLPPSIFRLRRRTFVLPPPIPIAGGLDDVDWKLKPLMSTLREARMLSRLINGLVGIVAGCTSVLPGRPCTVRFSNPVMSTYSVHIPLTRTVAGLC